MKQVIAVKNNVAVEIMPKNQTTEGGLIIPETAESNEPQLTCKVISIGEEATKEIQVGDYVYCHQRGGMDIMVSGKVMKILKDDEIFAIVRDE